MEPILPLDFERAEYFMRQALNEAAVAFDEGEVPIGSVIVKDDRIVVGRGHNQTERLGDPTAHAEILAIGAAAEHFESWRLIGGTLYTTVEPCVMCSGAAVLARLDRIVYGTPDPKFGGCASLFHIATDTRLNHRIDVVSGVLAEEAAALMRDFFVRRRQESARQS
ncbi:MAG: nucleoside deaminase [candidate division Zixibacteria bacterium]|nr:nucleoside deaminase [candidate division Zixibacteria bacterium]